MFKSRLEVYLKYYTSSSQILSFIFNTISACCRCQIFAFYFSKTVLWKEKQMLPSDNYFNKTIRA